MTATYPPMSRRTDEIELLSLIYGSIVEGRGAYYVSAPVTSGKRYLAWRAAAAFDESDPAYWDELRTAVAEPNCAAARPMVRVLRQQVRMPVIDPTAVPDMPGWNQDDFRAFWARVIERYVSTVVFVDGWSYSSGCSYEFLVAQRAGLRCLNVQLEDLPIEAGLALMREAIAQFHDARLPSGILEPIACDLACLARVEEERHERGDLGAERDGSERAGRGSAALQG